MRLKIRRTIACCCRGCMEKWWKVKQGVMLTDAQQAKAVNLIMAWINRRIYPLKINTK